MTEHCPICGRFVPRNPIPRLPGARKGYPCSTLCQAGRSCRFPSKRVRLAQADGARRKEAE